MEQRYSSSKYAAYRKNPDDGKSKVKNTGKTLVRFLGLIKPQAFPMSIVVLAAIASTLMNVYTPDVMGDVVDALTEQVRVRLSGQPADFGALLTPLNKVALYFGLSSLFTFIREWVAAGVSQKLVCSLRENLNAKLSLLPLKFYDSTTKGEVMSRMTNDIENVSQGLQSSLITVLTNAVQCVGALVMMLWTGVWQMTVVSIAFVPVSAAISFGISRLSKVWFKRYWNTMGDLNGHIEEMYTGHNIVRIFGHEKKSVEEFDEINDNLRYAGREANIISGVINPILTVIKDVDFLGIFFVGAVCLFRGRITIGGITAYSQYSSYFSSPIINISKLINSIQSTLASAERVFEFMDEEEQTPEVTELTLGRAVGDVRFEHVDFSYTPDKPLIKDLNIHAVPGSLTAIVGPTGSGKTTIVNLLMRFYEVDAGHIYIDSKDIARMSRDELRRNTGMVLQDTWLFRGTIKENIAYARPDATDEEIELAARTAEAHDFITALEKGYDTVLDEDGSNLSQGQRQLLTIARAILADPAILILDEATSSVDTRTELNIQEAMSALMKGRTSFVIAHRLSTIRNADTILVMRKGTIVEQGTHDELLARNGYYASLYLSQYTGGIPPEEEEAS
ncbi:MAG: ABC transporter ATP-binding protein/permease [Clostridia bacterium]|nr:ABC transporter ATP-binding protein/permease [Clostridia bacterium]